MDKVSAPWMQWQQSTKSHAQMALVSPFQGYNVSGEAEKLIRSMLCGTEPLDPVVFGAVAGLPLFVAIAACLVPAWYASRLDPMRALRTEWHEGHVGTSHSSHDRRVVRCGLVNHPPLRRSHAEIRDATLAGCS